MSAKHSVSGRGMAGQFHSPLAAAYHRSGVFELSALPCLDHTTLYSNSFALHDIPS